jgi:hypothetical protein
VKEILLTKGFIALVDDEDYAKVMTRRWHALVKPHTVYAQNRQLHTSLHRFILGAPVGIDVDHKDHNGLHCWRKNLRLAKRVQNLQNSRKRKSNASGFKGVSLHGSGLWRARIYLQGKQVHLGYFSLAKSAAHAYDAAAKKFFGAFACTNKEMI